MRIGYNTNGMAHHALDDAIELLATLGYQSVAITIDHGTLNPYDERFDSQLEMTRSLLNRFDMSSVIETGARFLLDPRHKHAPTLMDGDPAQRRHRVAFLKHAIDTAAALQSDCVSLWSGILQEPLDDTAAFARLSDALGDVVEYAQEKHVVLGFEPEPGMFIDTMDKFSQLLEQIDSDTLRLTLDVGHLHCQGEVPIAGQISAWADRLVNVHLEDMRAGVHEHLMFGEGEIDFGPVLAALEAADYQGGVHVELSRHSHQAPTVAQQSIEFLAEHLGTE